MSTFEPVEHNKQPNRIIYFGTNGCVGHYPLGINFTLSKEEYKDSREIDRIITDEVYSRAPSFLSFESKKRLMEETQNLRSWLRNKCKQYKQSKQEE